MSNSKRVWRWLLPVIGPCLLGVGATGQEKIPEPQLTKGIRSKEVVERSAKTSGPRAPTGQRPRSVTYSSAKPISNAKPDAGKEYARVGVTIWRLQIDGSKGLDQVGEENQTLEQVEANTPLAIGSNVRLGIESLSHDGYLYIINREQFTVDSYGTPRLIFPTLRTREGNNRVLVNERVLIPKRPSYFQISPSSTGREQIGEVLTIIISPTPLKLPAPLGKQPMMLSEKLFKEWESLWSVPLDQLEMEGGAGETVRAKDLSQIGEEAQQLFDGDAEPQTVYRALIKRGSPLLITVPLRFLPKS